MDSDGYLGFYLPTFLDNTIVAHTPTNVSIIAIILAIIFLLLFGIISASKTAFLSLTTTDLDKIREQHHPSDIKINALLNNSESLFATIQLIRNFINVTIIILCYYFFIDVFSFNSSIIVFLALIIISVFLLIFLGEIIPQTLANQKALTFCRFSAPIIYILTQIFHPFSSVLVRSHSFFKKQKDNHDLSLSQALELKTKKEATEENNILKVIIRFGGETVKEIMTSRLVMVDIDIHTPFKDVMKCIIDNAYSRIPIYSETRDNIKGILYIKDLLPHIDKGNNFRWQSLIRPAYFVPETKMIDDLLRDFQANRIHIAIVVDEFGGTSGLVTMEDIIEEIVGEIHDEYDEEERTYVTLTEHTWIFEGKTLLTDFHKITHIDEKEFEDIMGDADTLAGLLLEIKGEFPIRHEKISYHNYEFEVLEMNNRRIMKVKFTIRPTQFIKEEKEI